MGFFLTWLVYTLYPPAVRQETHEKIPSAKIGDLRRIRTWVRGGYGGFSAPPFSLTYLRTSPTSSDS